MADLIVSPFLGVQSIGWMLRNASRSGGVGLTGQEQVIVSPTGRWTATAVFNVFSGLEDPAALAYRSLIRRGRGAIVIVPETDTRGPLQWAGIKIPRRGVRHSDGATFSDGSGYGQDYTGATLAAAATMNATQIQIRLGGGLILIPGMRFSTPDDRLHEIDEVVAQDGEIWTVRILPWLRADYAAGTVLNFDAPRCRMRLASDDTGGISISQRSLSTPTIEFVEAL